MELNWSNMMHSFIWHIFSYKCPTKKTRVKKLICSKYIAGPSCASHVVKTRAFHCDCNVCSAAGGIVEGVERSGSLYRTMPHWWHLMVVQYVAVSTANINTLQCRKPYQQCEMPTIPAVETPRVLLP